MRFTLPKSDILRGFKSFTHVITEGKSFSHSPIRCYYCQSTSHATRIRAGFAVSRGIRSAVDRNKARRSMRESYRLNRHLFEAEKPAKISHALDIVFMFTGRTTDIRQKKLFTNVNSSMLHIMKAIAREET